MSKDEIAFCIILIGGLIVVGALLLPLLREGKHPDAFLAPLDVRRFAKVYAKKGEAVVCDGPEQHTIGIFRCAVYRGDDQDSNLLEWRQTPPKKGDPTNTCTCIKCGARWYNDFGHYHFRDGWR
jgi:hypothetical protein